MKSLSSKQICLLAVIISIILMGVVFRFYQITENSFTFYDEGLYLSNNRAFNQWLETSYKLAPHKILDMMRMSAYMGLTTGKFLWYFLSDMRSFFLGVEAWYFPRVLAAIFGCLTFWLIYLFSKQYYGSRWVGILSVAFLALYPSHIFYSRLALQETMTAFCFLAAMYFYFKTPKLTYRTFVAGVLFASVFFTSYRMIILPVFVGFCELWEMFSKKEKLNVRRYVWAMLTFLLLVFIVGNVDQGRNTKVTFAWMFYQGHLAKDKFELLNLVSYPYYLFKLESIFWGTLFFGNIYYAVKRQWNRMMPFALVLVYMAVFTMPQDKATRYLCAIMPFIAMASAGLVVDLYETYKGKLVRGLLVGFVSILAVTHIVKASEIVQFKNDYGTSMNDLLAKQPHAMTLSSQATIQKLYTAQPTQVFKLPYFTKNLLVLYSRGYRYIMIDPQIYVSYTEDQRRFKKDLKGYLDFLVPYAKPVKTYPHFNDAQLERFVLEHNENLRQSLTFLKSNDNGELGQLRVYSIENVLLEMQGRINAYKRQHQVN